MGVIFRCILRQECSECLATRIEARNNILRFQPRTCSSLCTSAIVLHLSISPHHFAELALFSDLDDTKNDSKSSLIKNLKRSADSILTIINGCTPSPPATHSLLTRRKGRAEYSPDMFSGKNLMNNALQTLSSKA